MSDVEDNGEEGAIESPNDNGPMSPSLQSEMEDAPPVAQPQQMSAEQLARHPVWLNSRSGQASPMPNARQRIPQGASKGGAKKKGTAAGADDYDAPRFERISAEALEMKAFQDMDGADSHLNSDDSDEDYAQVSADRRARENGPRRERRRQNDEGEDDDDEERPAGPLDEEDDAEEERSEHEMAASSGKKRRGGSGGVGSARGSGSAEDMMAAAAFGGGARRAFGESEADGRSETSSKRRKTAYKEAFPVRGVTCVGCAIATRITPVERFVKENIGRMTETALWKMAALCYKKDVAEPCEREGVGRPRRGRGRTSRRTTRTTPPTTRSDVTACCGSCRCCARSASTALCASRTDSASWTASVPT